MTRQTRVEYPDTGMTYILNDMTAEEISRLRANAEQRALECMYDKERLINEIQAIKSTYTHSTKRRDDSYRTRKVKESNEKYDKLYQVRDRLNDYYSLLETVRNYQHSEGIPQSLRV